MKDGGDLDGEELHGVAAAQPVADDFVRVIGVFSHKRAHRSQRLLFHGVKADFAFRFPGRGHEFADGVKYHFELGVVFLFQGRQFAGEVGMGGEDLAKLNKGTDDINAHGDGSWAAKDVGSHERAVFGKGVGRVFSVLAATRL